MTLTILQIIPRLDTGGAELSTCEITVAVVRAGGRMLVASEGGRMAGDIEAAGGELLRFPAGTKNPARIIANGRKLARLIRDQGVDLIHARSRAPAWSALIAARRTGIPFVTTYHGAYSEKSWLKNRYNRVMARGDIVIANSRFTAELIARRYGIVAPRVRIIYRGVDVAGFDPAAVAPKRVAKLRADWGVTAGQIIVLQAARLTRWKGHRHTIEALGNLQRSGEPGQDVVLVIAGDAQGRDSYLDELRDMAGAMGLADQVRFPGHCDDMPAAFAAAHVAVVGSDGVTPEAFGRAAAEAQAAGCPVIAARFGAPAETVLAAPRADADEITGWLVPPADSNALAEDLATALALDEGARTAIGARARQHVLNNFTAEAMQRQTLEVYDELLGSGLKGAFPREKAPPGR